MEAAPAAPRAAARVPRRRATCSIRRRASLATAALTAILAALWQSGGDAREISFQEFKNTLLEQGLVDRVEVSNKTQAKVYVRSSPIAPGASGSRGGDFAAGADPAKFKYYFNIGSLDSFERKLEEAQDILGVDPHEFVPVTYLNEVAWSTELARLAPTLVLLAGLVLFNRRWGACPGWAVPAGAGPGGGIFNVGKATVSTLDKNAKKVMFKDVAGCDEAKAEIMEFVDFLKRPKKYEDLGAKIPRGALLVGPPGTGKTLLAKATAGESGCRSCPSPARISWRCSWASVPAASATVRAGARAGALHHLHRRDRRHRAPTRPRRHVRRKR